MEKDIEAVKNPFDSCRLMKTSKDQVCDQEKRGKMELREGATLDGEI